MRHAPLIALALSAPLLLAGCEVGPDYKKPPAPMAVRFKELAGWKPASPLDAVPRGPWWAVYHDPLLDRLETELIVNNQTIRQAEAAYRQAQALVDEARSNLYPVLGLNPTFTRSGGGSGSGGIGGGTTTTAVSGGGSSTFVSGGRGGGYAASVYTFEGSASWSPDVWGRVRRQIESSVAGAQVSAADLASAALAQQTLLATYYFELRTSDALQKLLDRTVQEYRRSLQITQNQYAVGVAARSDVVTAETLLRTTESQAINVAVARQQYEHAIAVLIGHPPADLTIPAGDLGSEVPVAPASVPSRLLERRPDIAAAERTMAEQNALIGVAIAAFYPDITLNALGGFVGNPLGSLFTASNRIWSLGAAASQTVFDAGLRESTVRAARATYDESVAAYRQTVLTAFQQVEDDLSGLRILQDQQGVQEDAVRLAREAVRIALNEYSAGTVAYTAVITAQATALADEETLLSIRQSRIVTSVSLIQALGGGWSTADLPDRADLTQRNLLDPRNNY